MSEMFKENQIKMRNRRKEELRKLKREQRKENILTVLVGGFIIVATCMLLMNLNNNAMNDCMSAGHSRTYCERGL